MDQILALIAASLALMGSPGPATLSVAGNGAAFGFRRALPFMLGISTGTAIVLLIIACGVTGLVVSIPGARSVLIFAAAAYILYLAFKITTAPLPTACGPSVAAPPYWAGLALAIANPKVYAAIGAVSSGIVVINGDPTADAVLKVAILSCMIISINIVWLSLGATMARLLASPRTGRALNIGFAVLLVASVAATLLF